MALKAKCGSFLKRTLPKNGTSPAIRSICLRKGRGANQSNGKRPQASQAVSPAQFKEMPSLNEVEHLRNMVIKVPEEDLGELEEDEFYFHEIIGHEVVSEDGELIGTVKEILTPGANDVWVVARKGKKDALIPYIASVVKDININEKKIKIHVMEGLIDE